MSTCRLSLDLHPIFNQGDKIDAASLQQAIEGMGYGLMVPAVGDQGRTPVEKRVSDLLAQSRACLQQGDLPCAREALLTARSLAPGNSEVEELLAGVQRDLAQETGPDAEGV